MAARAIIAVYQIGNRLVVKYGPSVVAGVRNTLSGGAKGIGRAVPKIARGTGKALPYVAGAAAVGAGAAGAAANLAAAGLNATAAGANTLGGLLSSLSDQPLLAQPLYDPLVPASASLSSAILPPDLTPEEWTWLLARLGRAGPSAALLATLAERDEAAGAEKAYELGEYCNAKRALVVVNTADEDALFDFFSDATWPEREYFFGKLFKKIGKFAKKVLPVVGSSLPFVGGVVEAITGKSGEGTAAPAQSVVVSPASVAPPSVLTATQALAAALVHARAAGASPEEAMGQVISLARAFIPAHQMRGFVTAMDPTTAVFYRLVGTGFTGNTFEGLAKLSIRYPREMAQIVAVLSRFGASESDEVPSLERYDALSLHDSSCDCDICKQDIATQRRGKDSFWNHSISGQGVFYRSNLVQAAIDPKMPTGLHGEISFKDWPFRVRINQNQADGRALVSLMHELAHMFDRLLKLGLSHDQVHALGVMMATEAIPAGEAYRRVQLQGR